MKLRSKVVTVTFVTVTSYLLLEIAWWTAVLVAPYPIHQLTPTTVASLRVYDQQHQLLRQIVARGGGKNAWVSLQQIHPNAQNAFIAAEDHRFYQHSGIDRRAIIRAAWLNIQSGRMNYGGSTITMQLVRQLMQQAAPHRRGLPSKLRQVLLAQRLERDLSKKDILEHYLNRIYFGSGQWGIESAAQFYLGKPAAQLSAAEGAFLAVLPRNPTLYYPFQYERRVTLRQRHILKLMRQHQFITDRTYQLALRVPVRLRRNHPNFAAPHFVDHLMAKILRHKTKSDAREKSHPVTSVITTIDGPLQKQIEVAVDRHLSQVRWLHISQAGVIVIRHSDNAVLAWIGSRNYFDAQQNGATNAVTARLRPGSTLKPFVYALALERGQTAASLAYDVLLPHDRGQSYAAEVRQHGYGPYRETLAGSYNLAAVHTLIDHVGVPLFVARLKSLGFTTLSKSPQRYTPSIAVGDVYTQLIELTAAFSVFGRGGIVSPPQLIVQKYHADGSMMTPATPVAVRIFSPEVAFLIFDILSDESARKPMFGEQVPLNLPFAVALKTGTTKAYTDNWALGTTRDYTVGVWAGNFDGSPTHRVMSIRGAVPLLRATFSAIAARYGDPSAPQQPSSIDTAYVCPTSGMRPSDSCPHRRLEKFIHQTAPTQPCTWHKRIGGQVITQYPADIAHWMRTKSRQQK